MIAELATDLLAKISAVGGWATTPALSIGGKSGDPGLIKLPMPAAWIRLSQDMPDIPGERTDRGSDSGFVSVNQVMGVFAVTVFLPYNDDADVLSAQYPLLESIIKAIHGSETSVASLQWRYAGQRIALQQPDRLVYEQHYSVNFVYQ